MFMLKVIAIWAVAVAIFGRMHYELNKRYSIARDPVDRDADHP